MKISGYELQEKIAETPTSLVYRAISRQDPTQPRILKILTSSRWSQTAIAHFKHEYNLIKTIGSEHVIKAYEIIDTADCLAVALEDFNGISLDQFLKENTLSIPDFLKISIQVAKALADVHRTGIIHRDIKPKNILINPALAAVKLTDFGISSLFTKENNEIYSEIVITGTLPYTAPEQTGRINRPVDHRCDLYSVGITFYKMLTQRVPFDSNDPLELIHSHIAIKPSPPHEINPNIPDIFSRIILRLLEKSADERYQTASGLLFDLQKCHTLLKDTGTLGEFELGENDQVANLQVPAKLYGREVELGQLLAGFEKIVNGGKGVFFISGDPGIGKSVLVREISPSITKRRGYFISGKFEQFSKGIPFSAFQQACRGFIDAIVAESEERIGSWREKITMALGGEAAVVVEFLPELEWIIGKQAGVAPLDPVQAQQRFHRLILRLIGVLAQKESPLVLFVDDLQWADIASLDLLKVILTSNEVEHLFFIGAYRANEVDIAHPFAIAAEEIAGKGQEIERVHLGQLKKDHVTQLVSETLKRPESEVKELSEIVYQRTEGNPFFVTKFIKTLRDKHCFEYDEQTKHWGWSIKKITEIPPTANVVQLMEERIKTLPENVREVLKTGACIGNAFEPELLSKLLRRSIDEVYESLSLAAEESFLIQTEDKFRFLHDKVQEAAYGILDENSRSELHYQVGKLYLEDADENQKLDKNLFKIVEHLNLAIPLIKENGEKVRLAEFNLQAGIQAKLSNAYDASDRFFEVGIALLTAGIWEDNYTLAFQLHAERMESLYLTHRLKEAELLFFSVFKKTKHKMDKARLYLFVMHLYTNQQRLLDALEKGAEALKLFGFELNLNPSEDDLEKTHRVLKENLGDRKVADLFDLPEMEHAEHSMVMKFMNFLGPCVYIGNHKKCYAWIGMSMTNLAINYGNTLDACVGYAIHAQYEGIVGDYQTGFQFGELALKLSEKYGNIRYKGLVNFIFGSFVHGWTRPLPETYQHLKLGYQFLRESGEPNRAGYTCGFHLGSLLIQCKDVDTIEIQYHKLSEILEGAPRAGLAQVFWAQANRVLKVLKGELKLGSDGSLSDGELDEEEYALSYTKHNKAVFTYYLIGKMRVLYWFDQVDLALEIADRIAGTIETDCYSTMPIAEFHFYQALLLARKAARKPDRKPDGDLAGIQGILKKFEIWSKNCPQNFLHKKLLIEGEMLGAEGKPIEAHAKYEQSIKVALENQFNFDVALCHELAALVWLKQGFLTSASFYLDKACNIYSKIGAIGKVEDLSSRFPKLMLLNSSAVDVQKAETSFSSIRTSPTASTGLSTSESLDLRAVIQSAQTISQEIQMDRIIDALMLLCIQNAGAQKAVLLLSKSDQLEIESYGTVDANGNYCRSPSPAKELEGTTLVSETVVNYVKRTKKFIVLDDASTGEQFQKDTYIQAQKPRSIICNPILKQNQLVGILYLENNLTPGAFTPDRVQVLCILSSQGAISLENARLYQELEEYNKTLEKKVEERAQEAVSERTAKIEFERKALEKDLELTGAVQSLLLPKTSEFSSG